MERGIVFNVQRYSVDDGPGIRTTLFLKGCPLHCQWCANPESQEPVPQVLFSKEKCRDCGQCIKNCPAGTARANSQECLNCGSCVSNCWYGARTLCGESMSTDRVMEHLLRDAAYYDRSGGGITLSGGEPLMQAVFISEILIRCKQAGINTAIETCGCAPWDKLNAVREHLDLIYFDVKHHDAEKHRAFTGGGNAQILENLKKLNACHNNVIVRVPCIPRFNDTEVEIEGILKCISEHGGKNVELLPFHRFGSGKYSELGRVYAYENTLPMKASKLFFAVELGKSYGLNVSVRQRQS